MAHGSWCSHSLTQMQVILPSTFTLHGTCLRAWLRQFSWDLLVGSVPTWESSREFAGYFETKCSHEYGPATQAQYGRVFNWFSFLFP